MVQPEIGVSKIQRSTKTADKGLTIGVNEVEYNDCPLAIASEQVRTRKVASHESALDSEPRCPESMVHSRRQGSFKLAEWFDEERKRN